MMCFACATGCLRVIVLPLRVVVPSLRGIVPLPLPSFRRRDAPSAFVTAPWIPSLRFGEEISAFVPISQILRLRSVPHIPAFGPVPLIVRLSVRYLGSSARQNGSVSEVRRPPYREHRRGGPVLFGRELRSGLKAMWSNVGDGSMHRGDGLDCGRRVRPWPTRTTRFEVHSDASGAPSSIGTGDRSRHT